jgi:endo-1,4-beta-xylanase
LAVSLVGSVLSAFAIAPSVGRAHCGAPGAEVAAATTLRDAAPPGLLIGAAVMSHQLDDPALSGLIAREFNCLTGENEFKPQALEPVQGQFNFAPADKVLAFAEAHGMKMVGHTLLWHNQTPKWLFQSADGKPLSREVALANLKEHITAVMGHFKGRIVGWDVVNEAISDNPKEYLRDTPARRAIGDDYIQQAFAFAAAADPAAQLYYNDYSNEAPGKRDRVIRLIRELKSKGLRIDAVGMQGHWLVDGPPGSVIDEAVSAYAAEGVKVMITELDVDPIPRKAGAEVTAMQRAGADPYKQGLPPDVQAKLADRYAEIFAALAKHPHDVIRITFWGTHDGTSWLNGWPVRGRTNHPLLWDRNLQPKPAYAKVLEQLTGMAGDRSAK